MRDKKEARPSAAAPGRVKGAVQADEASPISKTDYSRKIIRGKAGVIARLLTYGQSNAIPLKHLVALTGLPGREVRRQIESERRQGIPILADCIGGYFLPADEADLERCVRSMRGWAHEILKTASAIERSIKEDDGPMHSPG